MNTLMENAESMKIGSVDFVSPSEIRVLLDLDAPSDVALNGGTPRPFPRVNSYVLVPAEGGFLVAQVVECRILVSWIYPTRSER